MIRASVAMAVYNGEKYIREQIDSILSMLGENDEIVISYDKSTDDTLKIICEYEKMDPRIHVVYDEGHSVESNFNSAVAYCRGKYIFFSDQDDVWINDKINCMVNFFENNPDCVVLIANGYMTDERLAVKGEMFHINGTTANPLRNYIKGTYLGCQMAFAASIRDYIYPTRLNPNLSHDLWTGIFGSLYGKVMLIDEKLIYHRLHDDNYSNTSKRDLLGITKDRFYFLKEIIVRYYKNKRIFKNGN